MRKKLIGIFICTLLIVLPAIALAGGNEIKVVNNILNENKAVSDCYKNIFKSIFNEKIDYPQWEIIVDNIGKGEVLDQYMDHTNGWGWFVAPWQWIAQGFKPTLDTLTRVELYYFRSGDPSDDIQIMVSIRDDLYGSDIVSTSVNAGQITHPGTWINIDLPDITIIPEQTYYIVCSATGGDQDNVYCWYMDFYNPYTRGDAWGSVYQGYYWWLLDNPPEWPQTDCCFKTYGLGESKSKTTFIIGRITNLTTIEEFTTFEALNIRCLQLFPVKFRKFQSGEQIYISDKYIGILKERFICGFFSTNI